MWDDRISAENFEPGETVFYLLGEFPPRLPGTIVAVHPSLNKVDVQWPSGIRRMSPEYIANASVVAMGVKQAEKLRPLVAAAKEMEGSADETFVKLSARFPKVASSLVRVVVDGVVGQE